MQLHRLTVSALLVHLAEAVFFMVLLGTFGHSASGNSPAKEKMVTPWERQYKIKPNEKSRTRFSILDSRFL